MRAKEVKFAGGDENSPHVDAYMPECMYRGVELAPDEDEGVAHLCLICRPVCPKRDHLLELLRETE